MSSAPTEACPFCGKTYKRLKSHLPHCKVAASSKTKHDVTVNQTPQLAAAETEPTARGKKSTQTLTISPQIKKGKKVSAGSPTHSSSPLQSENTTQSLSLNSASLPPSTKKKKQKLSEQIKTAAATPSSSTAIISTPPTAAKPKKKSLRDLKEAAKSEQVGVEGSASEDLPSASALTLKTSRTAAQSETKTKPDVAHPPLLSTETKPKTSKTKASKKAAQSLSKTKDTSSSPEITDSSPGGRVGHDFLMDSEGQTEDLSANKTFLKSGIKARITLQDVKATLGRSNASRQSSRPSILSRIRATDDPGSRVRPGASPVPLLPAQTLSDQLSISSQQIPLLRHDGSPGAELASPTAPLLSGLVTPPRAGGVNERLKAGHHVAGLSPLLTRPSSPHPFPQTLPLRVETLRSDGLTFEKSQPAVRSQNPTDNGGRGALTQRCLSQVRLRELPEWLAVKTPNRPRDVAKMAQKGRQWYYRKYFDVKKGGVGGVGMLLAGFCVLSYVWSYPRIKLDRWRKHH